MISCSWCEEEAWRQQRWIDELQWLVMCSENLLAVSINKKKSFDRAAKQGAEVANRRLNILETE